MTMVLFPTETLEDITDAEAAEVSVLISRPTPQEADQIMETDEERREKER